MSEAATGHPLVLRTQKRNARTRITILILTLSTSQLPRHALLHTLVEPSRGA